MSDRQFLDVSVADLIKRMSLMEKISLLAGPNWWNTTAIPRLGIPSVRMSDGPNGVRGSSHFVSTPAQCFPCGTSMGATFDTDLIHKVGSYLGEETKIKSSTILLAPTCNIQRNPLGGRAFESFSEDPHLSGMIAAAYVQGLQSQGVAATIKHFVGNDQEHERTAADSVISERALREVYLYPFMLAQKHAKPWAYMTSYGRIDGVHVSENPRLLQDILRREWGFEGIIMSDWYGTYSVDLALNAGLALEMPGPTRWRAPQLVTHMLSSQKVHPSTLDARVSEILTLVQQQARRNPDVVFGDGQERSRDSPELRAFCRRLAAEGMVVLKNRNDVLPLAPGAVKRVALLGPNMRDRVISGGGSAALKPTYVVTPYAGLTENAPAGITFDYHVGAYSHKYTPTLENFLKTPSGEPGWVCSFYNCDGAGAAVGDVVAQFILKDTRVRLNDFIPAGLGATWTLRLAGQLTMDKTAEYEFGLTVAGRAKFWVDGKLTVDNWTKQRPGEFFYGQGTVEEKGVVALTAGKPVEVLVEYTNTNPPSSGDQDISQPALMRGLRLGGCEKIDLEAGMRAAEELAAAADAVVLVAGLSPDWESEGFDRLSLDLPGPTNELIARVAAKNPNTVVVLQAGSAVAMPWIDAVAGVIQAWYSGNEAGNALADVVYGAVNPSGRLPLSLPRRVQDVPAFPNTRSELGKIHYREDVFVGYKGYQAKAVPPLFPFGFGLSYTTFALADVAVSATTGDAFGLTVAAKVTNTGKRAGSEVVQVYVGLPELGLAAPKMQLRGFAKARDVRPGESAVVQVALDKFALAYWDERLHRWTAKAGTYRIYVGKSSEEIVAEQEFVLEEGFSWTGL